MIKRFLLLIVSCSAFTSMSRNAFLITTPALLTTTITDKPTETIIVPAITGSSGGNGGVMQKHNKIFLNGQINEESCQDLREAIATAVDECSQLQSTFHLPQRPSIELHIQSNGGALMPTLAVVDAILQSDVDIDSYVEGYAASAATLLSIVCKKRYIGKHGFMLLHQLSAGTNGKLSAMEEELDNLKMLNQMIKSIYLDHTKIDANEIDELLKHDRWFNCGVCLEKGIVDFVL